MGDTPLEGLEERGRMEGNGQKGDRYRYTMRREPFSRAPRGKDVRTGREARKGVAQKQTYIVREVA